jgi:hypothetical protein
MNRKALFLMLACAASSAEAQAFEGSVTMNVVNDNGAVRAMTFMLKRGMIRFEPAAQVAVILDPVAQRLMLIMNAQRMYTEVDFAAAAANGQQQAQAVVGKNPSIVRTGKMETIAGYKCEHVTISDDDGQSVDACLTEALGGFRMPAASNPMSPQREAGWLTKIGATNFPLRVLKNGKTIQEVTAIEKKPLDLSLFEAPEGFQSFQMPVRAKKPPG